MELRELAERVLFSTRLEDKLWSPASVTDEHPGGAIPAPAMPGRPAELRFKGDTPAAVAFHRVPRLDGDRERGEVLHVFANHELLATELMALVLLRFPEAPGPFRRGVWQTLRDEQEHTRRYVERMRACGVSFGELPVSGYFWRAVSGMESPMDYVAGLSLTFEQANLDFAREFGAGFAAAGDAETAALLERIYRDEIGHVAYGLKWLRRWKAPGESDWDAFRRHLKDPLSPERAKGRSLNVAGRRAAGLDDDFIARLEVYARSRGRTPQVWWFNPFAEGHLAEGSGFTPVAVQRALALDLECLPQFLARRDDVVLVEALPSVEQLATLRRAGFALPEFIPASGEALREGLAGRRISGFQPWAWGPDSLGKATEIAGITLGPKPGEPVPGGVAPLVPLYSKSSSVGWLRELLCRVPAAWTGDEGWLSPLGVVGRVARSGPEVWDLVREIRASGHLRVVVKESLGLAGGNALRLWEPEVLPAQRRWVERAAASGRELVVEPWLDRVVDFSLHFDARPGEDRLVWRGCVGLWTDLRGGYAGNWAEADHGRRPPLEVVRALGPARLHEGWQTLVEHLRDVLGRAFREARVGLPVGVDAFVYRDPSGRCRLKPIVEVNPRYTMGRVTLELMDGVVPGCRGAFRLLREKQVRAAGGADFQDYAERCRRAFPCQLSGTPVPRLGSGMVFLNDPARARRSLAAFLVGRGAGTPVWPGLDPGGVSGRIAVAAPGVRSGIEPPGPS